MITVTLGEAKPQEKPFPKLMIHYDGTITRFEECGVGVHIYAPKQVVELGIELWRRVRDIGMNGFTDYNEPITIQNA